MSSLEDILGSLAGGKAGGGGAGSMVTALAPVLAGLLAGGGLQKILSGMQGQGLSAQADSWVGTGPNQPVDGKQVEQVLGSDQVKEVAQKLGVSEAEAADTLAEALPQVVDKVSPHGQLPSQQEMDQTFQQLERSVQTQ
jgi:uncharacterized protein YidB (DUF937 family)